MKLKIEIRKPNAELAFSMMRQNIKMLNWYAQNNRPYQERALRAANIPLINEMIEDREMLTNSSSLRFDEKYFERFTKELYSQTKFEPIINKLSEFIPVIEAVSDKFEALNTSWGFKIYEKYIIDLDYFGTGGKYDNENGRVICGLKCGQIPEERMIGTIIHEMVHLGIEDLIINPEKTTTPRIRKEEKERIVDNLCIYVMDGIIDSKRMKLADGTMSAFQPVASCASYMDKIVGKQPENNLCSAINQFLQDKQFAKFRYFNLGRE